MWVKVNEEVASFKRPYMEESKEVSENGTVQVSEELGAKLIEDEDFEASEYDNDSTN